MEPNTSRYQHLTLLHSNDLHGDFLAEHVDDQLIGGVSMLSGYINKVRREEPNTLYMIAGDMFRGSMIDTEFQGISTIEIMNALAPDIVSLGNHEVDYGIAHLLFLEKCCRFPIVNANVYIKTMGTRLFQSHRVLEVGGMKILVCGILTEEIMARASKDPLLGTFVSVEDAVKEIGLICDNYKDEDIDCTVLLTHIGFEKDIELAKALDPEWGVDLIIGGHSHTLLEHPEVVNDVLIVQAGVGTDQIGRFDLVIDTEKNCVHSCEWKTVPINDEHCPHNYAIEKLIREYKKITDQKYDAVLTTLTEQATHPGRYEETMVGNLFADILRDHYDLDLVLIGSGSLRAEAIGPIITRGSLLDMYSYDERLIGVKMTGAELKNGMLHMLKNAASSEDGHHSEYFQISRGFCFSYDASSGTLSKATFLEEDIEDEDIFRVALEGYHVDNLLTDLGLEKEPIEQRGEWRVVTHNIRNSLEEYMKYHTHLNPKLYGRTSR